LVSQLIDDTRLERLASLLAGEFTNASQALDSTAWFVNLRLWQRPVAGLDPASRWLFLEQANVLKTDQPYRQRLLRLYQDNGQLWGQFFQFRDALSVLGGGQHPERLHGLTLAQVQLLSGCRLAIAPSVRGFRAALPAGCRCFFDYAGQQREVELGFEVESQGDIIQYLSYDRGIDPQTGQGLWGALMGPYRFVKDTAFSP
jgi:hypothetical protein